MIPRSSLSVKITAVALACVVSFALGRYLRFDDPQLQPHTSADSSSASVLDTLIDNWTAEYSRKGFQTASLAGRELTDARVGYIPDRVRSIAHLVDSVYGVPSGVIIAQFILESRFGLNDIGGARNYFGHKCAVAKKYSGLKKVRCTTASTREEINGSLKQVYAGFAVYASIDECFRVHGRFLSLRWPAAPRHDPIGYVRAIRGYATDSSYGDKLIVIARRYKLF